MKQTALLLIAFLLLATLGGCASKQTIKADIEAAVVSDIAKKVNPVAIPDLTATAAKAAANGDADGAGCYTAVIPWLQSLATLPVSNPFGKDANGCNALEYFDASTKTCHPGLAAALESQRLNTNTPPPTIPPVPNSVITGCAVVVFQLKVSFAEFFAQLGVDVGSLYAAGGAGAAQTLAAIKAAQAAAAHP